MLRLLVNVKCNFFFFGNPADISVKLCRTQTRTYLTDFLVLSDDILALIRGPENAIELCRIDTINSTASLQTICLLELPPLVSYARLSSASLKPESNPSKSTVHPSPSRRPRRPPPRHSFSPSSTEAVLLTLTAKITGSAFVDTQTYTLAVHARTLLSYASPSSHASRSSLGSHRQSHGIPGVYPPPAASKRPPTGPLPASRATCARNSNRYR
jgi:hypothetical protein